MSESDIELRGRYLEVHTASEEREPSELKEILKEVKLTKYGVCGRADRVVIPPPHPPTPPTPFRAKDT